MARLSGSEKELTLFKFVTEGVCPKHRGHNLCGLWGLEEGRAAPEGVDEGLWYIHVGPLRILQAPDRLQEQKVIGLLLDDSWKTTGPWSPRVTASQKACSEKGSLSADNGKAKIQLSTVN